jgi:hypothetical protein
MSADAVLIASVVLSSLAVVLCILILYRSKRAFSAISPGLEQRLVSTASRGRSEGRIRLFAKNLAEAATSA